MTTPVPHPLRERCGERRDSRKMPEKIEGGPFGGQNRAHVPVDPRDDGPLRHARAVRRGVGIGERRIERLERLTGGGMPRNDARLSRAHHGVSEARGVDEQARRRVLPRRVFRERRFHEIIEPFFAFFHSSSSRSYSS